MMSSLHLGGFLFVVCIYSFKLEDSIKPFAKVMGQSRCFQAPGFKDACRLRRCLPENGSTSKCGEVLHLGVQVWRRGGYSIVDVSQVSVEKFTDFAISTILLAGRVVPVNNLR